MRKLSDCGYTSVQASKIVMELETRARQSCEHLLEHLQKEEQQVRCMRACDDMYLPHMHGKGCACEFKYHA